MIERLSRITAPEAMKALEKAGFVLVRQSVSHKIFRNKDGRRITIPYHSGKVLHPKILKSIFKDAGLTLEEFKDRMK